MFSLSFFLYFSLVLHFFCYFPLSLTSPRRSLSCFILPLLPLFLLFSFYSPSPSCCCSSSWYFLIYPSHVLPCSFSFHSMLFLSYFFPSLALLQSSHLIPTVIVLPYSTSFSCCSHFISFEFGEAPSEVGSQPRGLVPRLRPCEGEYGPLVEW